MPQLSCFFNSFLEYKIIILMFMVICAFCFNADTATTDRDNNMKALESNKTSHQQQLVAALQQNIELLLGRVEFGKVELVFHQGRLVQVEKSEKVRIE